MAPTRREKGVAMQKMPTTPSSGKNLPRAGNIGHITHISNKVLQLGQSNKLILSYMQTNFWRLSVKDYVTFGGRVAVRDHVTIVSKGHNIVLMSNHQTEADPAVIGLLLEKTHPYIAKNTISIVGDRVVSDPLCKPFSMGRNLICVYSKKHMHDVPELFEKKRRANTRSLKEMALLLRGGSQIIWIATSGGRDRPNPITKE